MSTPIATHFDMLLPAEEQERIGATPGTDESLRVMRVLSEYEILRARLSEAERERDEANAACQKWQDSYEVAAREVDQLTKDRDDWKAKHWKAHDDFHRQFLEIENLRQQVASATADVSILRGKKLQLEDARRGDFRCIVSLNHANDQLATALIDVLTVFKDDLAVTDWNVVTKERQEAWKNALESWQQYKLDHPVVSLRGMDAQANCRDEAGHYEEPK